MPLISIDLDPLHKEAVKHIEPVAASSRILTKIYEKSTDLADVNSVSGQSQEVLTPDKICLKYGLPSIIALQNDNADDNDAAELPQQDPKQSIGLNPSDIRLVLTRVYDDIEAIEGGVVAPDVTVEISSNAEVQQEDEASKDEQPIKIEIELKHSKSRDSSSGGRSSSNGSGAGGGIQKGLCGGRLPIGYVEGTDGITAGAATNTVGTRNEKPLSITNLSNATLVEARKFALDAIKVNK